jgi:hypothetical protein
MEKEITRAFAGDLFGQKVGKVAGDGDIAGPVRLLGGLDQLAADLAAHSPNRSPARPRTRTMTR